MKKSIQFSIFSILSFIILFLSVNIDSINESSLEQMESNVDSKIAKEVTSQKIKKEALSLITPYLQKSLEQAIEATKIDSDTFVGFPATCFAPDTNQEYIDEFYQYRDAINNSLKPSAEDSRFNIVNRWSTTATDGGGLGQGDVTTLTWSYVADGTPIVNGGCGVPGESNDNSDFIAFFNDIYGPPTTFNDFTTAPWHNIFVSMFNSWSEASGLIFVYEPNDDGATITSAVGVLGVRGDMRISGHEIDGNSNVLACNYFPENGDMIIDTADNFYANSPDLGTTNVLTHEIGHGLGIAHVCPVEQTKLMEPFITTAFAGPQQDDILAANRNYGDPDGFNDTSGSASFLGADTNPTMYSKIQRSIDDNGDVDYFSFTTSESTILSGTLTPTGTTYLDGVQNNDGSCTAGSNFNALIVSDLRFEVLGTNGFSVIVAGDANGAGVSENLIGVGLPVAGTYFVRVRQQGTSINNVQMYDLNISLAAGQVDDNDVAVTAIIEPMALETGLSSTEQIEITLSNLGGLTQSNIPYEVTVNGAVVATETYAPLLASGISVNINVPTLVDLSAFDTFDICAKTLLPADEDTSNDEFCKTTLHLNCIPTTTSLTTPCSSDGIKQFVLGTINVDDGGAGCNTDPGAPTGYSNRTDLETDLDRRAGFNMHTLQASTRWNDERIKVWIDLNDNGLFTDAGEEVLNQTFTITNGTLETFSITVPTGTTLGSKLLRARAFDASADQATTGPCDNVVFGETQDYTINIIDPTATCQGVTRIWNGSGWIGGVAPGMTDTAVINGVYDTATDGNIDVCELTVNASSTLTVDANSYVITQNDITVNANGTLLVSHQGSVVQVEDDANTTNNGTISVTTETLALKPRDFTASGSPMSGVTRAGDLAPLNRVMQHLTANFIAYPDIVGFNFLDDNFDNHVQHTGVLNPGEGYFIRPRPINATGNEVYSETFTTGTLNSGDIDFTVGYNGTQGNSYNLLANPYASAIDARLFIEDLDNTMVNEVYLWEHTVAASAAFPGANTVNHSMENISMFNLTGPMTAATAVQPNNGYLASSQGFGILATAAGTATFKNAMRITDNNNTLRTVEQAMNRVWVKVSNNTYNYHSTTLIGFTDAATNVLDAGYDSGRMATVVSLYSHLDDGSEQLAIQGRADFDVDAKVKVGFSTIIEEVQSYTISLDQVQGAEIEQQQVYLLDTVTGAITNLNEQAYTFTSDVSMQDERFIVQFTPRNVLNTADSVLEAITVYPNPTNGILHVSSPQSLITGVTITDVQGRLISKAEAQDQNTIVLDVSSLKSAVYFVTIQTENGKLVKQVIKK